LYEIGKDTFSFRFVRDEQNKCSSSWLFLFYNKTLIWSLTS
jgi:hypothetical protein